MKIIRILGPEEFHPFEEELTRIYRAAFAEPPWHEVFSDREVREWFEEMLSFSRYIVLVAVKDGIPLGSTFCFPLEFKKDLLEYLPQGVSGKEVLYLAELFVDPERRRKRIGETLLMKSLELGKEEGLRSTLQRTSVDSGAFPLAKKNNFKLVGEQEVESRKFIRGKEIFEKDTRVILLKL